MIGIRCLGDVFSDRLPVTVSWSRCKVFLSSFITPECPHLMEILMRCGGRAGTGRGAGTDLVNNVQIGRPASRAIAGRCKTEFVEQPGHVHRQRVCERSFVRMSDGLISWPAVSLSAGQYWPAALLKETLDGAIAGRPAEHLGQAVHGVGREHAGTGATGGAAVLFITETSAALMRPALWAPTASKTCDPLAVMCDRQHGATADHDARNVQAGGHRPGHDLITVRYEHQRIQAVGHGHDLTGIGD